MLIQNCCENDCKIVEEPKIFIYDGGYLSLKERHLKRNLEPRDFSKFYVTRLIN